MAVARKISALMLDLSGTVHVDDCLLPGVKEALALLRESSVPVQFVTNTSKESLDSLVDKLVKGGLNVAPDSVFTSLTAAHDLVTKDNLRPLLLLEQSAAQQFSGLCQDRPNCVLVGLSPSCFHYQKLNEAFQLVMGGARLVAVNKSRYYKKGSELALGTGAFVAGLEFSGDCQAEVVGKPSKTFFELAVARYGGVVAGEVLMVGDDVRDDVIGAQQAGLQGGLVRTGKYRQGDEDKFDTKPDFVFNSLLEMAQYVVGQIE